MRSTGRQKGSSVAAQAAPLVVAAVLLLVLLPCAVVADPVVPVSADALLNSHGLPLMMPVNQTTDGRRWYYEVPRDPVGVLVLMHRCGRNAEDFWPPSSVCPQCIGMPEGVSISRQALARGYALVGINSFNRSVGSQGRCWSWPTDATPVRDIVARFRRQHRLQDLPLFFTGCSSGGSLALRLPGIMAMDGIMPVAIGLEPDAFPATKPEEEQRFPYPPVAYVHFAADDNTDQKVAGMLEQSEKVGLAADEIKVGKYAIQPDFFSRRDPMISPALSQRVHSALKNRDLLDANNILKDDWEEEGGPAPWDVMLREELEGMIEETRAQQLSLKAESPLAQAQEALQAAGEQLLTIQELSAEALAASEDAINQEDDNPNFSDSDGVSPAGGGVDPYLSPRLLLEHLQEEMAVAWAHHTNLGDYTTAVLMWLERCGQANLANLAETLEVTAPAELSPMRSAASSQALQTWRACQAGEQLPLELEAVLEEPGEADETSEAAVADAAPAPGSAAGPRRGLAAATAAAAAAGAAVAVLLA